LSDARLSALANRRREEYQARLASLIREACMIMFDGISAPGIRSAVSMGIGSRNA
jgi:hypothetical protein